MINNIQPPPSPTPPALTPDEARKKKQEDAADLLRQTTRTALDALVSSQDQIDQVLQGADKIHRQIRRAQLPLLSLGKAADPAPALKEAGTQIASLVALSQQLGRSATLDLLRPLEAAAVTLSNAGYYVDSTSDATKGRAAGPAEKARDDSQRLKDFRQPLEMDGALFAESLTDASHEVSQPPSLEQARKVLRALEATDSRLRDAEEHTDPLQTWIYDMRLDGQHLASALDPKAPTQRRPSGYAEELEQTLSTMKQVLPAIHQINKNLGPAADSMQGGRKTFVALDRILDRMSFGAKAEDLPKLRSDAAALIATLRGQILTAEGHLFGTGRRGPAEALLSLTEQMGNSSNRLSQMRGELSKLDEENSLGPFGRKYARVLNRLEGAGSVTRGCDLAQAVLRETVRWPRDFTELKRALDDCQEIFQEPTPETHLHVLHTDTEQMRHLIEGLTLELPFGADDAPIRNTLANAAGFIEDGLPMLEQAARRARKSGI